MNFKFFKFWEKKPKTVTTQNTTEELAIEFLQTAVGSINAQLEIEIKRLGFSVEDLKRGRIKLERTVARSEKDSRFVGESFSIISNNKVNRLIMSVQWTPNSFTIQRYTDTVATAIKQNPLFGVKKMDYNNPKLVHSATKREIEIEAAAQAYKQTHLHNLKNLN